MGSRLSLENQIDIVVNDRDLLVISVVLVLVVVGVYDDHYTLSSAAMPIVAKLLNQH